MSGGQLAIVGTRKRGYEVQVLLTLQCLTTSRSEPVNARSHLIAGAPAVYVKQVAKLSKNLPNVKGPQCLTLRACGVIRCVLCVSL
jgi:hypothetical protein